MRLIAMTLLLPLLASCSSSSPEGEDHIMPVAGVPSNYRYIRNLQLDRESKRAFALEKAADLVIEFGGDGKLDIGVGTMSSSGRNPQLFNFGELVGFFDEQRHKDLLVVNFTKAASIRGSLESDITMVNCYFGDRGYRRVVICQFRSSSYPIHSDTKFRQ